MVVAVGVVVARPLFAPATPDAEVVEVTGDVPQPGMWAVSPPTIHEAVLAAGGDVSSLPNAPVPHGHRVHLEDGKARVYPPSDPLLVGLPVNVNEAEAEALAAIPGIGPQTANAIVQERNAGGLFYALEDLYRVKGVGPTAVGVLEPFVTLGNPGPRPKPQPVDINTADAETLQRLPHIGAVTAARIVVDRQDNGPYKDLQALQRVRGIGPATVRDLTDLAVAAP